MWASQQSMWCPVPVSGQAKAYHAVVPVVANITGQQFQISYPVKYDARHWRIFSEKLVMNVDN